MSEEGMAGRVWVLENMLRGVTEQLQLTQQLVESLYNTLGTLTGGKMVTRKGGEGGIAEVNVPVSGVLIRFKGVPIPKPSKIVTLGGGK